MAERPRGCGSPDLTPSPPSRSLADRLLGLGSGHVGGNRGPQGRERLPRSGVPSLSPELDLRGPGLEQLEGGPEGLRVQPTGERVVESGEGAGKGVASGQHSTTGALLNSLRGVIEPHCSVSVGVFQNKTSPLRLADWLVHAPAVIEGR